MLSGKGAPRRRDSKVSEPQEKQTVPQTDELFMESTVKKKKKKH